MIILWGLWVVVALATILDIRQNRRFMRASLRQIEASSERIACLLADRA
jgi:hypothetical protein